jgi:hypothetical protein
VRFVRTSPVRVIVSSALMAAGLLGVTSCTSHVITACGGQCSAPYQLQVVFKKGVSHQTAHAALTLCSASPIVIKVGTAQAPGGAPHLTATVYTRTSPTSARTASFLKCLDTRSGIFAVYVPS